MTYIALRLSSDASGRYARIDLPLQESIRMLAVQTEED
jgi:hypothetical protein